MASDLSDDTRFCLKLVNAPTSTGNFPFPGVTDASTKKLVEKLKENYIHNNAFFGGIIFHKCAFISSASWPVELIVHVLVMSWIIFSRSGQSAQLQMLWMKFTRLTTIRRRSSQALSQSRMRTSWSTSATHSKLAFISTPRSFHQFASRYYSAFITYFCKALSEASISEVLQRFLFSPQYNANPNLLFHKAELNEGDKHPEMLARFLSGVLHPMIHVGFGAEFGIVQQVAEGSLHPLMVHSRYSKYHYRARANRHTPGLPNEYDTSLPLSNR